MSKFMDKDFLLNTKVAKKLYHDYAAHCPIIDYHCHLSAKDIWDDVHFENITQVWLGGDHYKWRLMRCAGVEERYITGDASDYEKFCKWAEVIGKSIGNPLYHWSHLELQRFFDCNIPLSSKTCDEVWKIANEKLAQKEFSARGLINMSNVETICTTDDPTDTLEYHQKLAKDTSFKTAVLPAWRPDKALNIESDGFVEYIGKLGKAADVEINTFAQLKEALSRRLDYFNQNGCCLSDHGQKYVMYAPADDAEVERVFASRMAGNELSERDQDVFKTACLMFLARKYAEMHWTMQIHYGCRRNNNLQMMEKLGADTGFDTIENSTPIDPLAAFMGALDKEGKLPQMILYSLNPNDNAAIDTLCGCFQNSEAVCKVQHGSAWWFNDHFDGMTDQLKNYANLGYLAGFVGMLTDSRSFLSYPRHEYFRRILCRLIGEWVEDGRFPEDYDILGEIVSDISYGNAKRYFNFKTK